MRRSVGQTTEGTSGGSNPKGGKARKTSKRSNCDQRQTENSQGLGSIKSPKERSIETEIEIDLNTGDIYLNRDCALMLELARVLSPDDYKEFEEFFDSKPLDINGNKEYISYCG